MSERMNKIKQAGDLYLAAVIIFGTATQERDTREDLHARYLMAGLQEIAEGEPRKSLCESMYALSKTVGGHRQIRNREFWMIPNDDSPVFRLETFTTTKNRALSTALRIARESGMSWRLYDGKNLIGIIEPKGKR